MKAILHRGVLQQSLAASVTVMFMIFTAFAPKQCNAGEASVVESGEVIAMADWSTLVPQLGKELSEAIEAGALLKVEPVAFSVSIQDQRIREMACCLVEFVDISEPLSPPQPGKESVQKSNKRGLAICFRFPYEGDGAWLLHRGPVNKKEVAGWKELALGKTIDQAALLEWLQNPPSFSFWPGNEMSKTENRYWVRCLVYSEGFQRVTGDMKIKDGAFMEASKSEK